MAAEHPRIGLPLLFDHDHRGVDLGAPGQRHRAADDPRCQALARDLCRDHRLEIPARSNLQPRLEHAAFAGSQRMRAVHVHRPVTDMIRVRRMQRNGPILVIGHRPVGKRPVRLSPGNSRQSGNAEKIAALRPEGESGQKARHRGAAVVHGRAHLDRIRTGIEFIERRERHLAPVADCPHDGSFRAALQDLDVLKSVGPCRPVVGDEVGEDDAITPDPALHDGSHIDDRTARHSVRHLRSHRKGKRQLFVHEGEIAGRLGFAVRDRRRAHDHTDGGAHDGCGRGCEKPRETGGSPHGCRATHGYFTASRYKRRNSSAALCTLRCQSSAAVWSAPSLTYLAQARRARSCRHTFASA